MGWLWKAVKTITIVYPVIKGIISIWKRDDEEAPVEPSQPGVQK